MAAKPSGNKSVLVIGLGRFGGSVAATLDQMGQDVLAVDKNPEQPVQYRQRISSVYQQKNPYKCEETELYFRSKYSYCKDHQNKQGD